MKNLLFKAAVFVLALSLIMPFSALAESTSNSSGTGAASTQSQAAYEIAPHNVGLPVTVSVSRRDAYSAYSDPVYSYIGGKKVICGFNALDGSLNAVSSTKDLEARARENYVYFENVGLRTGESATVALTLNHRKLGVIKQEITVTLTDGTAEFPHLVSSGDDLAAVRELGLDKNYKQTADFDMSSFKEWSAIGDISRPFTGVYDGNGYTITGMKFSKINSSTPGIFGVVKGKTAGIFGMNIEGDIENSRYPTGAHGTVAGILDGGVISGCSFKGSMKFGTGKINVGGIVSEVINGGAVKNCKFNGKISSRNNISYIGGIVGVINTYSQVENCEASGQIISELTENEANVGGIAGLNKGAMKGCKVNAELSAYGTNGYLGGIAGYSYNDISESSFTGKIYSKGNTSWAGGIAGASRGTISDCVVTGEIGFLGNDSYIGGIVGRNEQGTVESSINQANVSGEGIRCFVGGIAGENYSFINSENVDTSQSILAGIIRCVSEGNIKIKGGAGFVGGIAGRNFGHKMVAGGAPDMAKSLIEKSVVKSAAIEAGTGSKIGRITAENLLVSAADSSGRIHRVLLSENVALDKTLVNGVAIAKGTADSLNGESLDSAGIDAFITKNGIE